MLNGVLMETSTVTLADLLYNDIKTYQVPKFQRDYSWKEENWEDLWIDLLQVYNGATQIHYMGPLIFKPSDNQTFIVIDGQQRLVTLSLLGIAAIKYFKNLKEKNIAPQYNEERAKKFETYFIGSKEPTKMFFKNKLQLNRTNNLFFKDYILRFRKPISISRLKLSNKLLYKAYTYFYERISEHFKNDDGAKLANFIQNILGQKLIFTQIIVQDYLSAYNVFETLNARGIELAPTDLIKNYLFSLVNEEEIDDLENKWQDIVDNVEFEKFPKFLRYYFNSYRDLVRTRNLYKIVRDEIKQINDVLNFLDNIQKYAELYRALNNPYDEFWNDFPNKKQIQYWLEIIKILKLSQHIPLIFAIFDKNIDLLEQSLKISAIIAFRFLTISNLNSNELETYFNKAAINVRNEKIKSAKELFQFLKPLYVDDIRFKQNFSAKEINTKSNKTLVKYILIQIENYLTNSNYDYNDLEITIEHILPQNYSDEWLNHFDKQEINRYIFRLGNITLLEPPLNKKSANKSFEQKRNIYNKSKFILTNTIAKKYEIWSPKSIIQHQEFLAEQAVKIWRLDF